MRLHNSLKLILLLVLLFASFTKAQNTNPVERQVDNPLTDTPNINPIAPQQDIKAPKKKQEAGSQTLGGDDRLFIDSNKVTSEGEEGNHVVVHEGNVDAHYGIYRLQADKITFYESEGKLVAEGSVVFDQGDDQRITGTRGEFNYQTKLGFLLIRRVSPIKPTTVR